MKIRLPNLARLIPLPLLDQYLLKHFLPALLVATAFFTFIVLIFFLKETIRHAVEKNLEFGVILELSWYALGWTLTLTIPMSFLLSTILVVGGLNADSEIIALRAGGITYPRIMRPFVVVAIISSFALFWFANFVVPRFADNMENVRQYILTTDPIATIKPGQFITLDRREGAVRKIYIERAVQSKDGKGEILYNIQVRKIGPSGTVRRLTELIIAQEGRKIRKKTAAGDWVKALRLTRGYLFTYGNDGAFQRVDFSAGMFDLNIQEPEKIKPLKRIEDMRSLTLPQLLTSFETIKNYPKAEELKLRAELEIHKRIALSFSVVLFVLLGFPLAVVNRRSGKGMGLGISVVFIFGYFAFFLSAETFSVQYRFLSPAFAAHLANFIMGFGAGWFSLSRLAEKKPHELLLRLFRRR